MKQAIHSKQLIIGLGKTGLSCAEYLNDQAIAFKAMDTRKVAPFSEQISKLQQCELMLCGDPNQHLEAMDQYLENISQIIVSPGVATTGAFFDLIREREINIIGDIELFAREVEAPVIAITGSNGKSTVTQLTGELLEAAGKNVLIGGNIGTPVLDLLKQATPEYYVLELSSFQLETTTSLRPVAGTVLNLSRDHLDRYASFEDYCAVKMSLLDACENIVVNKDEFPEPFENSDLMKKNQITIGLYQDSTATENTTAAKIDYSREQHEGGKFWINKAEQGLFLQEDLKIAGLHNVGNAMVSLALCSAVGVEFNVAIHEKLQQFAGLKHRCQFVGESQGVRFYNDSKATNVGATIAALKGLAETTSGELILIAGGDGKGADFTPLANIFKRYLSALVLLGQDAERLLQEAGSGIDSVKVDDMGQAVLAALKYAKAGDAVILAPACASFDMYSGFEQRGDVFTSQVEALVA
ncbi:MAG: UDP-N-acetylmuramoyl-L-alanine--D-glutamate ligase [Gammaproteobacteria bacterium]|nr:MAG: UDP-N-acetylmuramoyl-L-alanine--D-glutamate ligase [Gammaproteobacteria bacterium]